MWPNMGNNFSKHSYDKKEEEFEKFWNENYQYYNVNTYSTLSQIWQISTKSDKNTTLRKSYVQKRWFSDQQIDDQDLDFSKYWSFLPNR